MASDSRFEPSAARLDQALAALEQCLDRLEPGAEADVVAEALAAPVRAFAAAAREAAP